MFCILSKNRQPQTEAMKIKEWILGVHLSEPSKISNDIIANLEKRGVSISSCQQTESWWDDSRKCQKSFLKEQGTGRIFRLWRITSKDNWLFGEEVLEF